MSNRAGNKGLLVRLILLLVIGGAAVVIVQNMKSPLTITEKEVRQMINSHELVGLTLDEAAEKLQHKAPPTTDGTVIFEFNQVKGWRGQSVCLDVKDGKVTAATWATGDLVPEKEGS